MSKPPDRVIDFRPIQPGDFPRLWEWRNRPHVARWFGSWSPATFEASVAEWSETLDEHSPVRGFLILVDGVEVGYIESYRLRDYPELADQIALERDAVAADLYIGEESMVARGLGPRVVGQFYLRMMDETRLDLGVIDPVAPNVSAIRAYEKAGFRFVREVDTGDVGGVDHVMLAERAWLVAALETPEPDLVD